MDILLHFLALPLLLAALIWFFFAVRRLWREKKNLDAFQGNETARAMIKDRLKAELFRALGILLFPAVVLGLSLPLAFLLGNVLSADVLASVVSAAAVAVAGFFLLRSRTLKKRCRDSFKETFVRPELAKVFENLRYEPDLTFEPGFIRDLNFFRDFNGYTANDLISAEYKGLHFTQFDMKVLERKTMAEALHGVFRGRVMRFEFAEPFRGRVQVISKDFEGAAATGSQDGRQSVATELSAFAECHDVYASDPQDAAAVLTPRMIEGIFYLKQALDVPAAFCFSGNFMTVFLALTRDAFDVSDSRTLLEESKLLERDIALMTGFMDVMYFKSQAAYAGEQPPPLPGVNRAEIAAAVAEAAGASVTDKATRLARRGRSIFRSFLPLLIIAVCLIKMLCRLINLQGGFWDGMAFPIFAGAFIVYYALTERFVRSIGILALYLIIF